MGDLGQPVVGQERHQVVDGERGAVDELAVRRHVRAASRGVHDHVIDAGERRGVATGELPGRGQPSVVRRERSAAPLRAGDRHAPAVAGEHADRGAVHLVEPAILHASGRGPPPSLGRPCPPAVRSRGAAARTARSVAAPAHASGAAGTAARPAGGTWRSARSAGCGSTTSRPSHRRNRARRLRSGSTWTRARSIIRPNGTCDGQTSSHARHTKTEVHEAGERVVDRPPSPPRPSASRRSARAATPTPRRSAGRSGNGEGRDRTRRTTRGRRRTGRRPEPTPGSRPARLR